MVDQNTFTETIREVAEIIRTSAEPMSREEILGYFKDMELNTEQENMVLEFLLTPHEEPEEEETEESKVDEAAEKEEEEAEAEDAQTGKNDEPEDILPDSPMFQMYLEELKDLPEYSEKEQIAMYQALLAGDESMVRKISDSWMKNVLTMAKNLALSSEGFEDVVQEGNMALFLKLSDLCGSKEKCDVEAELEQAIEEAMKASIREMAGEDDSENAILGKVSLVNEAKNYLAKEKGSEPSMQEVGEYTKMSQEELADIFELIKKANVKKQGK